MSVCFLFSFSCLPLNDYGAHYILEMLFADDATVNAFSWMTSSSDGMEERTPITSASVKVEGETARDSDSDSSCTSPVAASLPPSVESLLSACDLCGKQSTTTSHYDGQWDAPYWVCFDCERGKREQLYCPRCKKLKDWPSAHSGRHFCLQCLPPLRQFCLVCKLLIPLDPIAPYAELCDDCVDCSEDGVCNESTGAQCCKHRRPVKSRFFESVCGGAVQ